MMFRNRGQGAPRHPVGRAVTGWRWLAGLAAAPVVAVSVFRAVPREWPTTAVQLVSFTPWLVLPASASLMFALLGRRRWMAGAAAGLVAVQVFWLLPLDYARAEPESGQSAPGTVQVRVMSLNAKLGKADAAEIVRLVRANHVSLLLLQEYTTALEERLAAVGLAGVLPNRVSAPAGGAAGNAVYSVHELVPRGKVPGSHFPMPTIRVTAAAQSGHAFVDLTNVHTRAPVGVGLPKWRSDLAALAELTTQPGNVVLAGDFNATYDHAEFRRLLAGRGGEAVDVGTAQGSRLLPTWPMDEVLLPGITLDHIITSRSVQASDYTVQRVPGTDHAAVMVTLSVPATG